MSRFIAAMDHSGGSTGGVLERYGLEYTEENKMDLVHDMRLRMVNSPMFTKENIWGAILYKDTLERGMCKVLNGKGIETFLKIDSGCEDDGTLKNFDIEHMIDLAVNNFCFGTKMRSIVKTENILQPIIKQQFKFAKKISNRGLIPIVEPEVPIDHPDKNNIEMALEAYLKNKLDKFHGKMILKLTLPEQDNLYYDLSQHKNVYKLVGLSGGYNTSEACERLKKNKNMSASFSRALSESLLARDNDQQFNMAINLNITAIVAASS